MQNRLLDRYIYVQLLEQFLLGVIVFTLIAFFSDTLLDFMQEASKYGISPSMMLTMIGLQLPRSISLVLPASAFLAVLMTYNKLNNDFEIIAMRTSGIRLSRLVRPALFMGILVALMSYTLNDFIVPFCNHQTELLQRKAVAEARLPAGGDSFLFKAYDSDRNLKQIIYVGHYEGRELGGSTIVDMSKPGLLKVVQAKSGEWDPEIGWRFFNANIYAVSDDNDHLTFVHSDSFLVKNIMSSESRDERRAEELESISQGVHIDSDEQSFWEMMSVIKRREALGKHVVKKSYLSLWKKLTMPLSCIGLILIGVALAITPPRQASQRGFVFALLVLFLYYVLQSATEAFGKAKLFTFGGMIPVNYSLIIAAWLPLFLLLALALLLLKRKSRVL